MNARTYHGIVVTQLAVVLLVVSASNPTELLRGVGLLLGVVTVVVGLVAVARGLRQD